MLPKLHTIGRVAGKHGFHGDIQLQFNSSKYAVSIEKGEFLFICIDGKGVPFLIERYNPKSGIVKLTDVDSPEFAEELTGLEIQTDIIPETDDFSGFNPEFMVGYSLLSAESRLLGTIITCQLYPAGYMFNVSDGTAEFLVPAAEDWVLQIDTVEKIIKMDLPDGLINLEK